jgi:hypothetical protein
MPAIQKETRIRGRDLFLGVGAIIGLNLIFGGFDFYLNRKYIFIEEEFVLPKH